MKVRTRFAPSPTGYMHIGNLRTALYAWLFARHNDGDFLLRIEDTDRNRLTDGAEEIIYNTLKDTGLTYDEGPDIGGPFGPYVQSQRKEIYGEYAQKLIETGAAYYCFCTTERLGELREAAQQKGEVFKYDKHCLHLSQEEVAAKLAAGEAYVIRQNIPTEGESAYDDEVYGHISVPMADMEDNVLMKADGWPTYNFANVVDDHLMEITHVIRGHEYLSSTPKYNLLYDAFGWQRPKYIHLPTVMKDKQKKLSKRNGDASYEDLIAAGYLSEAIVNYIALLGWSPAGEQEIFTLQELADIFTLSGLNKSPSIFDIDKLTWMNKEYILAMDEQTFYEKAKPYLEEALTAATIDKKTVAKLIRPRVEKLTQIPEMVSFFNALPDYDISLYTHKKMKTSPESSLPVLQAAKELIEAMPTVDNDALYEALKGLAERLEVKSGAVLWPVRIAITGTAITPGGATEIAEILGKEETLRRLELSIAKLAQA